MFIVFPMKNKLVTWINRFLVADVFLVLFAFIWFVIAVIGKSLNIPLGFDLWYSLWQPLFNPAIGILFLGVFGTWGMTKLAERFGWN